MPPQSWGRQRHFGYNAGRGSVAEWFKAPVLKTGDGQPSVSSNLTASATPPFSGRLSPNHQISQNPA